MSRTIRPWRGTGIRPLDDLYKEMDNLVTHFFGDEAEGNGNSKSFVPRFNLAETESGFEVTLELPGINPDAVSVEVHENQLTVSGSREAEKTEEGKRYHRVERQYGEFRRVVTLPTPIDEAKITADYQDGLLVVTLPKSEKVRPRRIPINAG